MADASISYKGGTIAELDYPGTKTLKTAGTYCEGDIMVAYAPRSRTYEITLPKASGWMLLTELDEDVLAHIDDDEFTVVMTRLGAYSYEWYAGNCYFVGNKPIGYHNGHPVYGLCDRIASETLVQAGYNYYPANNKTTDISLGGHGQFCLNGKQYRFRPGDGFITAGTYRLTFYW